MLWRRHDEASAAVALAAIHEMHPGPEWDGLAPIAEDWQGRQYAWSYRSLLLFHPGSAEVWEVDYDTLDEALEADPVTFLRTDLFARWQDRHPEPVPDGSCVGYRVPLFAGGLDTVENLVVLPTRAYWSLAGQMWSQVRDRPPGS